MAFLAARLDEDEGTAKAAELRFPGPWDRAVAPDSPLPSAVSLYDSRDESFGVIRGSYAADHIARHDPARVLREVAFKRAILGQYATAAGWSSDNWPLSLRLLAAIWSDHSDYDREWKP